MDAILSRTGGLGDEYGAGMAPAFVAGVQGASLQVLLLAVAQRRLGGVGGRALGASFARTGLALALMGAAVAGLRALLPGVGLLVTDAGGLALAVAIYIITALALGSEELRELPGLLLNR